MRDIFQCAGDSCGGCCVGGDGLEAGVVNRDDVDSMVVSSVTRGACILLSFLEFLSGDRDKRLLLLLAFAVVGAF